MNRHQSNPFLSDWDADDNPKDAVPPNSNSKIFDDDLTSTGGKPELVERRRSAGHNDNPFSNPDRRLYHRNMSSFEAASLQLEQVQMQDGVNLSSEQSDLIAKMRADFESMIATNDKEFSIDTGNVDAEGIPIRISAFDPFETITDDDISLTSPAKLTEEQVDQQVTADDNDQMATVGNQDDRPRSIELDGPKTKIHESIDDDDAELVSTPVRNIKSCPGRQGSLEPETGDVAADGYPNDLSTDTPHCLESSRDATTTSSNNNTSTSSIAKASMFASLLASAESSQHQSAVEMNGLKGEARKAKVSSPTTDETDHVSAIDGGAHVISGSNINPDGSIERPVGFFDPFETVIDKDDLTSLMAGGGSQTQQQTELIEEASNVNNSSDTSKSREMSSLNPSAERNNFHKSSISVETVIENANHERSSNSNFGSTPTSDEPLATSSVGTPVVQVKSSSENSRQEFKGIPRPKIEPRAQQTGPQQESSIKLAPSRRPVRQKKLTSAQDDSSDDEDDDDRIQIIIRARDTSKAEGPSTPAIVPLLPPPPSKSSAKQARELGQVEDMPSPIMSYKSKKERRNSDWSSDEEGRDKSGKATEITTVVQQDPKSADIADEPDHDDNNDFDDENEQFIIKMSHSIDDPDEYAKPETPLYDDDTSYELEEFPVKYEGVGWEMMLRYPPKKKITSNRFWKKIFVRLAQVPLLPDGKTAASGHQQQQQQISEKTKQTCIALQIFDKPEDKKPIQDIPIQPTYTVSEINSQQFDQFGKLFTIKLQYIFYKERVGVRQGQLARFINSGHVGTSTTSGGHGVDPLSIGAIKRLGAPIEHSPQISQIIKLGCVNYEDIRTFKICLEDYLFRMPIHRDRALSTYKTEEVQMAVRDETYIELNQIGQITKQMARTRLFLLSFLNGMPYVEVGVNDCHRQGREVVGRMDILPIVTDEWIRLEAWELHPTVEKDEFEKPESRLIKLSPPDATYFEMMRFRVRPPRNRELPLQVGANMSVSRTKVEFNCEVMVPGCIDRKQGQIPCEDIAIRLYIPECWVYFFREEKHFRMGSKKSVNRRPGVVKGLERFLGGGGGSSPGGHHDPADESSLIEVTSGLAKYEHHHHSIVWRAARWPKDHQSAYVQNTMKIRLPLTAYDKMPENFYEYLHVEFSMPATTVSHTAVRSIAVSPCDDEPPEKYVRYMAKYEYKVKMRLNINISSRGNADTQKEASPIVIIKQPDLKGHLQREEDSDSSCDEPLEN